jgi:hypothetical protein
VPLVVGAGATVPLVVGAGATVPLMMGAGAAVPLLVGAGAAVPLMMGAGAAVPLLVGAVLERVDRVATTVVGSMAGRHTRHTHSPTHGGRGKYLAPRKFRPFAIIQLAISNKLPWLAISNKLP